MQRSLSSASPSVSPNEVKLFGQLAAEGLSATEIPQPQELTDRTEDVLTILEQAARLGETQPALAVATTEALAALLEMRVPNQEFRTAKAVIRLRAVDDLIRTAWTSAVIHQREVPDRVLTVIGANMPGLLSYQSHLLPSERFAASKRYVELLTTVVDMNSNKKEVVESLARAFDTRGDYADVDTNMEISFGLLDLLNKCSV